MRRCFLDSLELAHELVDTVLDKKGSDILLLDIREQSIFADYFLICNGDNERQLRALADNIAKMPNKKQECLPKASKVIHPMAGY